MTPTEKRKFAKLEKALTDREETIYVLNKLLEKSYKEKNDLSDKDAEIKKLNDRIGVLQEKLDTVTSDYWGMNNQNDGHKKQIDTLETTIKTILKYSGQ